MIIIAFILLLLSLSKLTVVLLFNKDLKVDDYLIKDDVRNVSMVIVLDSLLGIIASLGLMSII